MKTVYALLLASSLIAPATWAASPPAGWDKALLASDDAYWTAYNKCDLKALSTMNTNDLEFYHDVGGVMRGRKLFDKAMANNICGNPSNNVRREAIKSSVHV